MGWNNETGQHEWGYESSSDYYHRNKELNNSYKNSGGNGCMIALLCLATAGLTGAYELYQIIS